MRSETALNINERKIPLLKSTVGGCKTSHLTLTMAHRLWAGSHDSSTLILGIILVV